jgi:hypothetical protein
MVRLTVHLSLLRHFSTLARSSQPVIVFLAPSPHNFRIYLCVTEIISSSCIIWTGLTFCMMLALYSTILNQLLCSIVQLVRPSLLFIYSALMHSSSYAYVSTCRQNVKALLSLAAAAATIIIVDVPNSSSPVIEIGCIQRAEWNYTHYWLSTLTKLAL